MSVEFRQRTPGEYVKIFLKRKWLIILPAIAVATSVAWVVFRLPDLYESSTLIVVKPSTLPNNVVPMATEETLTRQLTSIAQVVTSRSSLEPLIDKYDLYRPERMRREPIETIIDAMRSNIKVEVNTSRNDVTNGFSITYRGRDPHSTQSVAAELASKYINAQTKNTIDTSQSAKEFIDNQEKVAKDELDEIDKRRVEYMQQNINNLPAQSQTLLGQLTGLREQQKAYISEIGRFQDRRSALVSQLGLIKKTTAQQKDEIAENTTDPKTTPAWAQLTARKADLEAQYMRMSTELKPKHPDMIAKQAEINSVKEAMDEMLADRDQRIKEKEEKLKDRPDLQVASLEAEIKMVDGEIKRQQAMQAEIDKQIADVITRINNVPGVELVLGSIDREYQA